MIKKPHGTLTPAYGRDYKSAKEFLKDWNEFKDFLLHNPSTVTYINREDAERYGGDEFQIRWDKKTQTTMMKRGKDGMWVVST